VLDARLESIQIVISESLSAEWLSAGQHEAVVCPLRRRLDREIGVQKTDPQDEYDRNGINQRVHEGRLAPISSIWAGDSVLLSRVRFGYDRV